MLVPTDALLARSRLPSGISDRWRRYFSRYAQLCQLSQAQEPQFVAWHAFAEAEYQWRFASDEERTTILQHRMQAEVRFKFQTCSCCRGARAFLFPTLTIARCLRKLWLQCKLRKSPMVLLGDGKPCSGVLPSQQFNGSRGESLVVHGSALRH